MSTALSPAASSTNTSARPTGSRPTWAEVDLKALQHNAGALSCHVGSQVRMLAVIKADAYGHGAVPVARALLSCQRADDSGSTASSASPVEMLGVASVDEGLQLRQAGITAPILLLSAILPAEAHAAVRARLVPTVFTREVATALNEAGAAENRVVPAHLKIDTGMGRLGVWCQEAAAFHRSLRQFPYLSITGAYTHFACADEHDDFMTESQRQAFEAALLQCGIPTPNARDAMQKNAAVNGSAAPATQTVVIHAANSAAALRYPGTRFDMVRIGLALYGVQPTVPEAVQTPALRPVMTLRSRVTHLKEVRPGAAVSYGATWRASAAARIATVPIGYADGYPRRLGERRDGLTHVSIRGLRYPVVGRVTMDQILVDCSRIPNVHMGEIVTLFGGELPVEEVASWAETIPYEILCGIACRVPRVYKQ